MKFTHRITWGIGLNRAGVPYPPSEAIEAARVQLERRGFDGFTVQHGTGYWKGEPEACLIVSLLINEPGDYPPPSLAYGVAGDLAECLGQEAVAYTVDTLAIGGLAFS